MFGQLIRRFSRDWTRPHWRILYYHEVLDSQRDVFAGQLDLFSQTFEWCSISDGLSAITNGTLDRPLMSVTFDDADASLVDVVIPILAERGISACCYTVPDYVEKGVSWRSAVPRPIMSWNQLSDWLSAGHEVGSHTLTHASLDACQTNRIRQETLWSQEELQQKLGVEIAHFAYPWGEHTSATRESLRSLNAFRSVATIHRGPMMCGHDPFSLRRDAASFSISPGQLEQLMRAADRLYWLRHFKRKKLESYCRRCPDADWNAFKSRDDAREAMANAGVDC